MDIISLPITYDNEQLDGRYRLVTAAVKRAKHLSQGALPRTQSKAQKITTLAIEEVVSGAIDILTGDEAVKANEQAQQVTQRRIIDEAQQKEAMPEDMSELEKDLKTYLSEKNDSEQKRSIEDIFGAK